MHGCSHQVLRHLHRYEKYDGQDKKNKKDGKHMDAFSEECAELEAEIERLMAIAAEVSQDGNKAAVASKNAEIRCVLLACAVHWDTKHDMGHHKMKYMHMLACCMAVVAAAGA